jgi:hypothetical protein
VGRSYADLPALQQVVTLGDRREGLVVWAAFRERGNSIAPRELRHGAQVG